MVLRSPPTEDFDLLSTTASDWSIWLGRIDTTRVNIACNLCIDDTDCNLNGYCQPDGTCLCKEGLGGLSYIGSHCEIKLKEECGTIKSEKGNVTYSIQKYSSDGSGERDTLFQEYNRPVYTHIENFPNSKEGDVYWLLYTGRRWFGIGFNVIEMNVTEQDVLVATQNFHAFWGNTYSERTLYVSDITTGDSPVGTDFYEIGERGNQFGPYGALYPLQLNNQTGRGVFRCTGPLTYRNISSTE